MAELHASGTVGEDLRAEANEQRERYPSVRHPVENVAPGSLGDKKNEKVRAEVRRREPALRHDEERHQDGAVEYVRRVQHEQEAEAARLGRGSRAHEAAHEKD
jgi:hypothetical protein